MKTNYVTKPQKSAHNGVHHWWLQRITAIALIPLVIWFVVTSICFLNNENQLLFIQDHQASIVLLSILIIVSLFHSI